MAVDAYERKCGPVNLPEVQAVRMMYRTETRKTIMSRQMVEQSTMASQPLGWTFEVAEVSAGYYRAKGVGPGGMTVERDGEDPDQVLAAAVGDAAELNARVGVTKISCTPTP